LFCRENILPEKNPLLQSSNNVLFACLQMYSIIQLICMSSLQIYFLEFCLLGLLVCLKQNLPTFSAETASSRLYLSSFPKQFYNLFPYKFT